MAITILQIQNELHNRSQSWFYESVWRTPKADDGHILWLPKKLRVEIRCGAYDDQSHATISEWSEHDGGWKFFTSLPTDGWYADAPSYTTKLRAKLVVKNLLMFSRVEATLVQSFVRATYGPTRDYRLEYLPDA